MTPPAARALVVDDTPLNLKLLTALSGRQRLCGADCRVCRGCARAARRRVVRPAVLDVRLPRIDGLTFARTLRADPAHQSPRRSSPW